MNNFTRNSLLGAGVVGAIFAATMVYTSQKLPRMNRESHRQIELYFQNAKTGDFQGAHRLLSPQLQTEISRDALQKQWRETQKKYGEFQEFVGADSSSPSGARANLWPPYVDYMVRAKGTQGSQVFYFRVAPEEDSGKWQITQLRALDQTKIAMPKGSPMNDWLPKETPK